MSHKGKSRILLLPLFLCMTGASQHPADQAIDVKQINPSAKGGIQFRIFNKSPYNLCVSSRFTHLYSDVFLVFDKPRGLKIEPKENLIADPEFKNGFDVGGEYILIPKGSSTYHTLNLNTKYALTGRYYFQAMIEYVPCSVLGKSKMSFSDIKRKPATGFVVFGS